MSDRRIAAVVRLVGEALRERDPEDGEDVLERARIIASQLRAENQALELAIRAAEQELHRRAERAKAAS